MATKIFLWCVPRCLSSVFYRSIHTLRNSKCFFEPFAELRLHGKKEERENDIYADQYEAAYPTYSTLKEAFLQEYPSVDILFVKDFPRQLRESDVDDLVNSEEFGHFIHTFLIRDPERAIYSFYSALERRFRKEISSNGFKIEDVINNDRPPPGYADQHDMFSILRDKYGKPPIVVDAADLQAHPDETMKSYCEAVGINYEPSMTTWKPLSAASELGARERPYWYDAALQSSGFKKTDPRDQKPVPLDQLPKDFVDYIDKCRPLYEEMRAVKINPFFN